MRRKHGIDRGTEGSGAWGGYPSGSGVPPPLEKLQRTSNTTVLRLIFGIWFGVFPISTARRPRPYSTAVSHPTSRLCMDVGIASVGTESVGIVWCTHCARVSNNLLWRLDPREKFREREGEQICVKYPQQYNSLFFVVFARQINTFMIERRHLHNDEPFFVWRNEGNRLLNKFLPEVQLDGSVTYKPSAVVRSS